MPEHSNRPDRTAFFLKRFVLTLMFMASAGSASAQAITNLQQLTQTLDSEPRVYREIHLEAVVCAASRPKVGVLVVQDKTGAELLELGNFGREILPGERISLQGWYDFF